MLPVSPSARRLRRAGPGYRLAMAVALASGAALGIAGFAAPAFAAEKDKDQKEAKPVYNKAFVDAYKPIEDLVKVAAEDATKLEPARALIAPLVATISNDDERLAAGQMVLNLGITLKDQLLQRQGLLLQLESNKVAAERLGQFNYFVGAIAWQEKDYPLAQTYLTKAFDLGYREKGLETLIFLSHLQQNDGAGALAAVDKMDAAFQAAGQAIPEETLRQALQYTRDQKLSDQIDDRVAAFLERYPNPANWALGLTVLAQDFDFGSQESLDLFRLMRRTGAMDSARDYVDYIEAADARRMSNEVLPLLNEGIEKGLLNKDDLFVKEALDVANSRASADRTDAQSLAADARSAADGVAARAAGDNFMSLGQAAEAEEMFRLALEKGGVDADRINMRLGIVQADQGKYAEARESLGKVGGIRQPIATLWLAYVDNKQAGKL